jgi:hypothetical protein
VTGWVCPDTTGESLAEGLEYFLTHPDDLSRAGSAALKSAGAFNAERFATAWAAAFDLDPQRADACGSPILN